MKRIILSMLGLAIFCTASAQIKMPPPSTFQTIKQGFGMGTIELSYSRPNVKGRTIMGDLEPWGVLWRTGANMATKITFSDTVSVMGERVNPGSYAIYTIPQKNGEWTFILNRGADNAGVEGYKESEDVLRKTVKVGKNAQTIETLTMQFSDVMPESLFLNIKWADFALKIPITTSIKERLAAQFEEALRSDKKPYWQAAGFYADLGGDKKRAIQLMDSAMAQMPEPMFFMVFAKAKLQADTGDRKNALVTAKKALEASKKANNAAYVRLSEKLIQELAK